ncbi:MAG: DegT/DnrJ/EryC1/StrS family aminotransferase [Candidatus Desantisbacteria bacterium]
MKNLIERYEDKFKDYLSVSHASSFWKGRVALYAILKAMGIGEGDEVLVEGFTCVVVPNAVIFAGAKPVYVAPDPKTYNMDINQIESKITSKTKAIIAQHTFGLPADMDAILEIAQRHNLKVIEDCAPALGATYKGKKVGALGDAAFFSTQWSKGISTGLGGVAVTNNPEIGKAIERFKKECMPPSYREMSTLFTQLRLYQIMYNPTLHWFGIKTHRLLSKLGLFIPSSTNEDLLSPRKPNGYEKLFTNFQAKIGLRGFEKLDKDNEHRRYIASLYDGYLRENNLPVAYTEKAEGHIYLRYPLLVKDKNAILKAAQFQNIEIGDWFISVLHPLNAPLNTACYRDGDCPVGEKIAVHLINLPTHLGMNKKKVVKVIEFLKRMRDKV